MNKKNEISKEAREAFDKSYHLIRQQNEQEKITKKKYVRSVIISVGIFALVTIILIGTPVGIAVSKLLGFDKFDSETLAKDDFILPQNQSVTDKDITISLLDFYSDGHEVGLHLQGKLPKNHVLLKDDLTTPLMSLTLTDSEDENIMDLSVGEKWSSLDKEERVLDFYYTLSSETWGVDIIDMLVDGKVNVYRIGAIYEEQKDESAKPGFHELKGEYIEGNWTLDIDTSKLKLFEDLEYKTTEENLIETYQFLVSPTKIMIEIPDSEWDVKELTNHDIPKLIGIKEDKEAKVPFTGHTISNKENGEVVHQLMFDFGGYDSYEKFILTLPNQSNIEFENK